MANRILIADDSSTILEYVGALLSKEGAVAVCVSEAQAALKEARSRQYQLLLTDLHMPGMNGMELLKTVRDERLPLGVVVLTGYGDAEIALEAMKAGADDFVTKPFEPDHLVMRIDKVINHRGHLDELERLQSLLKTTHQFQGMAARSAVMRRAFEMIERVAGLGSTVLLSGETGTGKELSARAIHALSPRAGRPFTAINCAAIVENLLESELFGHERGAYTGADRRKLGKFELAGGGTLFLDEIGEISPAIQAKLLRVLQTGSFERLGGEQSIRTDVRLIAATNKRLDDEVRAGRFRADLFYRLNVVQIRLPALRERVEDIPLLVAHFLKRLAGEGQTLSIEAEAMQALIEHDWPGNVRELENTLRGALAVTEGSEIRSASLPPAIAPGPQAPARSSRLDINRPLAEVAHDLVAAVERDYLARLLSKHQGNLTRVASHSGLSRKSVLQKIRGHGLSRLDFRPARITRRERPTSRDFKATAHP